MEAALFHKSGGDFIRSGTEAAQVAISMNGNKLAWFKPEGSGGGYNLNGQEYTKGEFLQNSMLLKPILKEYQIDKWRNIH